MKTIQEIAIEAGFPCIDDRPIIACGQEKLELFAALVREDAIAEANAKSNASWTLMCEKMVAIEREAIYNLVMEAPFKEFDRQQEEFDGEAANAMKAMAFSLTSAIRARSNT